jgi:serine/threonine-protein kinase PknK
MNTAQELAPGALLQDRYEVVRRLGRGGMATTYLVHDRLWDTAVALKLLRPSSAALLEAMRSEFALLRELFHPHLCQVHEFGSVGGDGEQTACFYTADYVQGVTLAERARSGGWQKLRQPLCDALGALHLLHRAGLRHGDFKPDNVLVDLEGHGVLIDLGCAAPLGSDLTAAISGTPGYLAPELLAGQVVDHRADLYAVGASLHALAQTAGQPLPAQLGELAARLKHTDPARRPADVNEVLEALGSEPAACAAIPVGLGRLVGRGRELQAVQDALLAMVRSRPGPRSVCLVGPEGIGKSRLLAEIRAGLQGRARVLEANALSPHAISRLLGWALGTDDVGSDVAAALDARDQLSEKGPLALLVDDAHLLEEHQRSVLQAFARSLEPTGALLLVATESGEPDSALSFSLRLELRPLQMPEVAEWLGPSFSHLLGPLWRLSGGHPGTLRSLVLQLGCGSLSEAELGRSEAETPLSAWLLSRVASLGPAEQWGLGVLAASGRPVGPRRLQELGVQPHDLQRAQQLGLIQRDGASLRLVKLGESQPLLGALGASLVQQVHLRLGGWLRTQLDGSASGEPPPDAFETAERAARCAQHLALGGEHAAAKELLLERAAEHEAAPRAWAQVARTLADALGDPELQLTAARLEQAAGKGRTARERLEALLRTASDPGLAVRVRLELGACQLKLGNVAEAVAQLERALSASADVRQRAQVADLLSQALCKQGAYARALEVAEGALEECTCPRLRADLEEAAGVALGYLGRLAQARERLDSAAASFERQPAARRQTRSLGARALVCYQMGDLADAARDYAHALELAQSHALSDQVALAALNCGAVCHQRGQWAEALGCYERGMRMAVAMGQASSEAHLRFNLAKLYADLGLGARAERCLERCEELCRSAGLPLVQAAAEAVRGELGLLQGDVAAARRAYTAAREQFQQQQSIRECAEVELHLGELALCERSVDQAAAHLERAALHLQAAPAKDVVARLSLTRARHLLATGNPRQAASLAAEAARSAHQLEQADLEGEAQLLEAEAWLAQGSELLSRKHRTLAQEVWEQCVAALPAALRDAFWQHPKRRAAVREQSAQHGGAGSEREHKLELLVDIFRRLNSSLKTEQVLERAMDAAIELSGAERGFVLLSDAARGERRLRVAVARNVDREQLERSHLKFSRAIAEQVVATGEPVVTASAQTDDRFSGHESVHAMHLQSVICVPVVSPAGLLGALYLDNRFQTGRFSSQDVDLVLAFADQVAIALNNARLHHQLRGRNRQLAQERQRVEKLLREKEAEVVRLGEQVSRRPLAAAGQHDYGEIVGSSRAMQQLFAVLDRVIETDLPILITGESGTGKELVVRAIHTNHPRRRGPLVSINCAALPESLLESELFGYERGAFTGADRSRDGLLVQARSGTLFLDELGEMPLAMQVKLLRVLQEHEVRPLGSQRTVPVDIRLVCATNRNLAEEVRSGRFREDLYYRVSAVELRVPPLRERVEDLPELVHHLLVRATRQMDRKLPDISRQALRKLMSFSWPGNVRQLENVLTRALVLADADRITAADIELPDELALPVHPMDRESYARHEAELVAEMLAANQWNVAKVARLLHVSRPTLYRRLRRYGLARGSAARADPSPGDR